MGLFDFLKPKREDPLAAIRNDPSFRRLMIAAEVEQLSATMSNLKSVGREAEAESRAKQYLAKLGEECLKKFCDSSDMLNAFATSSMLLGQAPLGKQMHDEIIKFHEDVTSKKVRGAPAMDLTVAYTDAGRLVHACHGSRDDEYRFYWLATEARPPTGCEHPATNKQKAIAHNFAHGLSATEACRNPVPWEERERWHDHQRRVFAPECNWDDVLEMVKWMRGE